MEATILEYGKISPEILIEDITNMVSFSGIIYTISVLYVQRNSIQAFVKEIEDFSMFGIPKNIEKHVLNVKRLTYMFLTYSCAGTVLYFLFGFYNIKSCKAINLKYDMENVCGLLVYTWYPFEFDYFPMKQLIEVLMLINIIYAMNISTVSVSMMGGIIMNIILRLKQLNEMFSEAFKSLDNEDCNRQLIICYKYHQHILL